jgi:hypothetical protein
VIQGKRTFTVHTKASKESAEQTATALTVDLTGCPEDVVVGLAIQSLTIRLQNGWRKNGIPAKAEVKMADFAPGKRVAVQAPLTVDGIKAAAKTFSPEDRAALLKLLQE